MEVGSEDVLRQVDGQIAEEHVERRRGIVPEHFRHHAEYRHREHEAGAEGQAGVDRLEAAALVSHDRQRADDVAERGGYGKAERIHSISRASAISVSRVLSDGSSSTRSSSLENLPDAPAACAERLEIAATQRQVAPRERVAACWTIRRSIPGKR